MIEWDHTWSDDDRVSLTAEGLAVLGDEVVDAEAELAERRQELEAAARRLIAAGRN